MKDLIFFNKEGDNLNLNYNKGLERYEGDLLFHENGTDTFKTIGLYMFEKIPSFEFTSPGDLYLEKFQLFNEYGFNITGSKYQQEQIIKIESVNNDFTFFSKWIWGQDFEKKFPVGSKIIFDNPIFEFSTNLQSFVVISSKKNAIMIISSENNKSFNSKYLSSISDPLEYNEKTISGINSIGIYNYINKDFRSNLSSWSEREFYSLYFNKMKFTLINTQKNDGVYTVKETNTLDNIYTNYFFKKENLLDNSSFIMELILKTDLPIIYNGQLSISDNIIKFGNGIPKILKPGKQFSISGGLNDNLFITPSPINTFSGNVGLTYYATQSQVLWNNNIFECINAYTQSATSSITPDNTSYWSQPTYLNVQESLFPETLLLCDVHLTTNKFYYQNSWTQSSDITLLTFVNKYKEELNQFNITLDYNNDKLISSLNYSGKFAEVNYYVGTASTEYKSVGTQSIYENVIQVEEQLISDKDKNYASPFKYNIIFKDLDEYGFTIVINGMIYQQEIEWVYNNTSIDMDRTIDKTIKSWVRYNYAILNTLGIETSISYIGTQQTIYSNTLVIETLYPNVPIDFEVKIGSTGDYVIEHSELTTYDCGSLFSLTINDKVYDTPTVYSSPQAPNIPQTISNWIDTYQIYLVEYGIYVYAINNRISFNLKDINKRLDYRVNSGKSTTPGIDLYKIVSKISGNNGSILSANQIKLSDNSDQSFVNKEFATGMVVSVNNTIYPLVNQEYNLLYTSKDKMVLSYQGPFWGTTSSNCQNSPFTIVAFTTGFGATNCNGQSPTQSIIGGGDYNQYQFDLSFSLNYRSINSYIDAYYDGTENLIDIEYLSISESIYGLGNNVIVVDSKNGSLYKTIVLSGNTQSICMEFNPINNFLYVLTHLKLYVIDPILNVIVTIITLANTPVDCKVNTLNGDVYVSYSNVSRCDIWTKMNVFSTFIVTQSAAGKMVFNEYEADMYITCVQDSILRINGTTRQILSAFSIPDIKDTIYYESISNSVYVMGDILYKILNNTKVPISDISGKDRNNILYNNLTGTIVLSQGTTSSTFSNLSLDDGLIYTIDLVGDGDIAMNQYDGDIYVSSLNSIMVVDIDNKVVKYSKSITKPVTKIIYNPSRKSIWGIQPELNRFVEINVTIDSNITPSSLIPSSEIDNQYGTMDPEYTPYSDIWLKTRQYIRRPRENFEGQNSVDLLWKWEDDTTPEIFMFDFSGNQLKDNGSYTYNGAKPLELITLNRTPNKDISKVLLPQFQQTIFEEIKERLDYINSSTDLSVLPTPMELFIGFNSSIEGPISSVLSLYKREYVDFTIISNVGNNTLIEFELVDDGISKPYGMIKISPDSPSIFVTDDYGNYRGLSEGQIFKMRITDNTNNRNKYISFNNGKTFKIRSLYSRLIVVDFIDGPMVNESTLVRNYPNNTNNTYLDVNFIVLDKQIGRFNCFGQTEIEDIRYKIELSNTGHNIDPKDVYIFKSYDINEQGIDWGFLNRKRKEMLIVRNDIYSYIGSYKSIINSINYFGYNDLELYEYYRNINIDSPEFFKLFKLEIPDIFDSSVEGWTEKDFLKNTMPNPDYEDTNLFNLTYRITDREGNNLLTYSLSEVLIKLQGLKKWLENNVIPITHKILDITGRGDFVGNTSISHKNYDTQIINIRQSMSPINFSVNEAYLMPINSGSTVYTVMVDFNVSSVGEVPEYFMIKLRTYKTYEEWSPFYNYSVGSIVRYYDKIYESIISNNKTKNPRRYESTESWNSNIDYNSGQIVKYNRSIYIYKGSVSSFNLTSIKTPPMDTNSWLNITEWKEVNYVPVQSITEYRTTLESFNFTIDSNIDPFVTIEVTSDNGYGQNYGVIKNYEIRSTSDITSVVKNLDPIGHFTPIYPITTPMIT